MIFNKVAFIGKVAKVNITSTARDWTVIKINLNAFGSNKPFEVEITFFQKERQHERESNSLMHIKDGDLIVAECVFKTSNSKFHAAKPYLCGTSIKLLSEFTEQTTSDEVDDLI